MHKVRRELPELRRQPVQPVLQISRATGQAVLHHHTYILLVLFKCHSSRTSSRCETRTTEGDLSTFTKLKYRFMLTPNLNRIHIFSGFGSPREGHSRQASRGGARTELASTLDHYQQARYKLTGELHME